MTSRFIFLCIILTVSRKIAITYHFLPRFFNETHINKMKYTIYTIDILFFLLLLPLSARAQFTNDLFFSNVSVKDGLSQGMVNSIYKDTKDFIWIGTGDGLNRYDGYEFRIFKHIPTDSSSISNNIINCIQEDSLGRLWIGTIDGLNCYCSETETFKTYKHIAGDNKSLSNNYVKSLFVDKDNIIWIGTDRFLNRFNPKTEEFEHYNFEGKLGDTRIYDIHKDKDNYIWLATNNAGLIRFDPETKAYVNYTHDVNNLHSISSDNVYTIFEDSKGQLWFGTWEHGVNSYNRARDNFDRFPVNKDGSGLNNNQIRCISESPDGKLWIGTFEGLNIYDPLEKKIEYCLRHNNIPGSLSYNTINYILRDEIGTMWLGTHGGGIDMHNPLLHQFSLIDPKQGSNHDYGIIGPLIEYEGKIWIGTEGGGLASYDLTTKEYQHFDLYNPNRGALNSNTIKSLCVDRNGFLWIGTYAGGVQVFDIRSKRIVNYYSNFGGIDNNIVNDIFQDSRGNIWVGSNTSEGIHTKAHNSDHFMVGFDIQANSTHVDFPWIRTICEPSTDELWFGSIYNGIFIYKDGKTTRHISTANSDLTSDYISVIIEDSEEQIWIGTYGGGVCIYDPETEVIRSLTTADGLLNDNICSIIQDDYNTMWISTVAGISKFSMEDSTFTNYSYNKSGFPIEILNLKSGLLASDGQIYFGGSNGIIHFYPQLIVNNSYPAPVRITRLSLNNKTVSPKYNSDILEKSITETKEITLKYNQTNNITIEFAALNYIFPENNQYMYYLQGYEESWNEASFQRQVTYTNLPAGEYIFKVKASNNSGIWNDEYRSLVLKVLPPPWKTWWAYALYIICSAGLIYAIIYYFISRMKLKNEIYVKQIEKQAAEESHQIQLNMFTNFSHELRTPLTLILNPLKNILADSSQKNNYRDTLEVAYKNAKKMLSLVNQLLDLRKHESGNMNLKLEEVNIIQFIEEILILFRELTNSKQIALELHKTEDKIVTWFDPSLMEKVFYNLLSNAIKNTPANGKIDISIHLQENEIEKHIEIEVYNTGEKIPEKDIENIFSPFFQINKPQFEDNSGTGLGLHITRNIIQRHYGSIIAENRNEGGVCFRILLPINKELFNENEFFVSSVNNLPDSSFPEEILSTEIDRKKFLSKKELPIVLLVEDNMEMRQFMKSQLQEFYTIYEAENGKTGWELAEKIIPDVIISDIMMPEMDGLALSIKLKSHVKTSHIPIILLTARTSILQIEEGLMTGADDYITKPFDAQILKLRIQNMIDNRTRVKQAYLKNFTIDLPIPNSENMDKVFLDRAYAYVKDNISNSEMSIEEFGSQLNLSRTQLYRKIKALTGMSPSLFVSTLRLKYAAELLLENSLSVSEIAYQAGFASPSYFTTAFKKLYNLTPTEYLRHKRNN